MFFNTLNFLPLEPDAQMLDDIAKEKAILFSSQKSGNHLATEEFQENEINSQKKKNSEPLLRGKLGMSEWRAQRAFLFKGIKDDNLQLTQKDVAAKATEIAKQRIHKYLKFTKSELVDQKLSEEIDFKFRKDWSHGKDEFYADDVNNDYDAMGWEWINSRSFLK